MLCKSGLKIEIFLNVGFSRYFFDKGVGEKLKFIGGRDILILEENLNEMVSLDFNGDRIIDGYRRYFYTGYSVSDLYLGLQFNVRAEYTNAMYPWDTKYANQLFTFN